MNDEVLVDLKFTPTELALIKICIQTAVKWLSPSSVNYKMAQSLQKKLERF